MSLPLDAAVSDPDAIEITQVVDTFGLLCPLPIIKTGEALRKLPSGAVIELISTDPGVVSDMKDWCRANRHDYIKDEVQGRVYRVWVKKG